MSGTAETLYAQEYFEYLQNRSVFRKLVRKFYLRDIQSFCSGETIDLGCGTGELLILLPPGSIGFEVNKVAVDYCLSRGLHVSRYFPETDDYKFTAIPKGKYNTFTMNHVLEHIDNAQEVIRKIFESCHLLGIRRIVFTVPGYKGYLSDKTHRTFINKKYFLENRLLENPYYRLRLAKYFPLNLEYVSRYFRHNELRLVFDRRNG